MGEYYAFCRGEVSDACAPGEPAGPEPAEPVFELPPEVTGAETVGVIYDEVEGLG